MATKNEIDSVIIIIIIIAIAPKREAVATKNVT